jgi:hypothetical protein
MTKRKQMMVSTLAAIALVGAAWALYFTPHLHAGVLALIPGEYIGYFLFFRNGQLIISNVSFMAFETAANVGIYATVIWFVLHILYRHSAEELAG